MTEKQKRRMVMIDDDLWGYVKEGAKEAGISLSAYVRMSLHLALARESWPGPFPEGEPWVGFDLDGTLAHYESGWAGVGVIGDPIARMVDLLQEYRAAEQNVAIVTARISGSDHIVAHRALMNIEVWCATHLGVVLPVTCRKDYGMMTLYDDRAKQVTPNTGRLVEDYAVLGREEL